MATYIKKINGVTQRDIPHENEISFKKNATFKDYAVNFNIDSDFDTGDIIYLINDLGSTPFIDTDGDVVDITKRLYSSDLWHWTSVSHTRNKVAQLFNILEDWFNNKKYIKITIGNIITSSNQSLTSYKSVSELVDDIPANIFIDNKHVKTLSIGNQQITELDIEGHTYSFAKNINISNDDVESFVAINTTWGLPTVNVDVNVDSSEYSTIDVENGRILNLHDLNVATPPVGNTVINSAIIDIKSELDVSITTDLVIVDATAPGNNYWRIKSPAFFIGKLTVGKWLFETGQVPVKINPTATIDTTAQLKGLDVTYSKSTGLVDGDTITVTVKAPTNGDTLNGGTTDVVFSNVVIANPSRTITEKEVDDYISSHLRWSADGTVATINFTSWSEVGSKLSSPDSTFGPGNHDFVVTALPGYTINGKANETYTIDLEPNLGLSAHDAWRKFVESIGVQQNDSWTSVNSLKDFSLKGNFNGNKDMVFVRDYQKGIDGLVTKGGFGSKTAPNNNILAVKCINDGKYYIIANTGVNGNDNGFKMSPPDGKTYIIENTGNASDYNSKTGFLLSNFDEYTITITENDYDKLTKINAHAYELEGYDWKYFDSLSVARLGTFNLHIKENTFFNSNLELIGFYDKNQKNEFAIGIAKDKYVNFSANDIAQFKQGEAPTKIGTW